MRQPLSIYFRAMRLEAGNYLARGLAKARVIWTPHTKSTPRAHRPLVELREITAALDQLRINTGDRIMVHSGISNLGRIQGGPLGLFKMLRDRVGPRGLLLFPVFPFGGLMQDYLGGFPTFDAILSPTKMGILSEVALKSTDRTRSLHPTHSIAGFGDESGVMLDDHHLDKTPFGPHSPFWRLADSGGKILVMGVGLSSVTGFHLTEDKLGEEFPVRVYLDKTYQVTCSDENSRSITVETSCHDPFISRIRDCFLMESALLETGIYKKVSLGKHYIGAINFSAMDALLQRFARTKRYTIYGKPWG